jgi:hypothetical protein
MISMVGYDVSYRRNAFKTRIDPDGVPSEPLESLFEQAAKSVQKKSGGHWLIINKDEFISSDSYSTIELRVLVPAGIRQRIHVITAIAQFEEVITANTGVILDEALRSIEEDGPKCEICTKKPEWVRRTQFAGDHYFCAMHAEAEEDFGDSSSNNMFWKQLEPITT